MKKAISALLSAAMLLSLAACGGSGKPGAGSQNTGGAGTSAAGAATPEELVAGFSNINITLLGQIPLSTRKPVEDRLTPIWREKTKVIPEIVQIPEGQDYTSWLQMQIMGETVPDVIALQNGIMEQKLHVDMLKAAGMLRPISLEEMKQYMPRTTQRLADLGLTMDEWYAAFADPDDGKLWQIPSLPTPLFNEEFRNTPYGDIFLGKAGYGVWVRDDILRMVYPDAMSEKELIETFVAKNGEMTIDEIVDIPLNNLDDMYKLLTAIKELNYQEGGKNIIPAHLQFDNTRGAMWWSLMSITNLSLSNCFPLVINEKEGTEIDYQLTPEWKNYVEFMNKGFSEGLFGSEFYTQKQEQREAKIINGEYAVVNMWAPIDANRAKSAQDGKTYGWRYYPLFNVPVNSDFQNAAVQYLPLKTEWNGKGFNAKTITDEMMPQMLNWIDWHYSYEAAELRTWGTPDMYTGDKLERRFTDEYRKVEESLLNQVADETGDAWYYGICGQDINTMWNHEVYGLTMAGEMDYVYAPKYVYPKGIENFKQYDIVNVAWQQKSMNEVQLYKELPLPEDVMAAKATYDTANATYAELSSTHSDALDNLMIKAITGGTQNFEENYAAYLKVVQSPETVSALKAAGEAWGAYMKLYVQHIEKIG